MGHRPDDAAAFVESVERTTNDYLVAAAYDIFATDARWVTITDGARQETVGIDAIGGPWAQACMAFKAPQFTVQNRLAAATDAIIVPPIQAGVGAVRSRDARRRRHQMAGPVPPNASAPTCWPRCAPPKVATRRMHRRRVPTLATADGPPLDARCCTSRFAAP